MKYTDSNLPPGAESNQDGPYNEYDLVPCPDCNGSGDDCYMCSDKGKIPFHEYEDLMFSINNEKDL